MNKELAPGTTLSHYRIVATIGAGGMGEVYLAEDTKLERRVVLKLLPHEFAADADRMRRFVLEAKSASALNHPNIITIYEVGEHNGTNFIATEYIDGRTLNNCDSFSLTAALEVATQIASALQAAHSAGIVHRDIKPDNVMIRPDGLVKVLDFGIAKQSGVAMLPGGRQLTDPEAATALRQHTGTGMIIGTATYMSPEQARGKSIDSRSDIFSFGVLLYEMFSGRRPFTGENAMDVIGSIVADEPTPLRELRPSLPGEIDRIVSKALRKNRDERYQTAGELLVELRSVQRRLEFAELELSSAPERRDEVPTQMIPAQTTAPSGSYNSIAVLPFSHLSADVDNEYFCDGLAEELLNALSKIENLRVAAKSSAFSFKGRNVNVSEIGRALNVNTVLEGSVRKSGDRLRISVQLSNASDGYQLWSERYDRELKDIFYVQDEITLAVVNALKLRLLSSEKDEVLKRYTKNAEAYQLYLRGRFLFFKRTPEGFRKAIEYFKQAIDLDSEYALAYSGLADCYTFLGFYEHEPPGVAENNLKAPAFRSLELDDTLAETHTSVALYRSLYQWDFVEGDKEHKKAIALNPQYALAHHLDSATVILLGKNDEAIAAESRAIELDPFTAIFNASLGWWFYLSSRNDEAIAQSLRTIEIAPNHFFAYWVLGLSYALAGKNEDAIAALKKALSLTDGTQFIKGDLARVYAASGQREEALQLLAELKDQSKQSYISPVNLAKIYFGLGDIEQTYEQLERSVNEHSVKLPWLMIDPAFNNLRSESRFLKIWRRVGLPENQIATTESETVVFHSEALHNNSATASEPDLKPDTAEKSVASAETPKHVVSTTALHPPATSTETRQLNRNWIAIALVVFVTAAIGAFFYFNRAGSGPIDSIAVLPFLNRSNDVDSEYLSDGLTESLIYRLSQLPNLKVSPTSSVLRYKGKEVDPQKIAAELGVSAVMSGRMVQRGDNLTISVELIDARSDKLLWGEQYERKMSDLLATQRQIAREIVDNLKLKVSGAEKGLAKHYTESNEAYQLYLRGRFYWSKRSEEGMLKSLEYFQEAIHKDPDFALAYSGLADSYILLGAPDAAGGIPPAEALPKAKTAALKALEIDETLAEAHASLAHAKYYDREWTATEQEYKRAIELNPNYPTAPSWYAVYLMSLGRYDEALAQIRRAQVLDPLSLPINMTLGWVLLTARRPEESVQQLRKTLEMDPNFILAHHRLGLAYEQQAKYDEAIAEFKQVVTLTGGKPLGTAALARAYALAGRRTEAQKTLVELQKVSKERYVSPAAVGAIYEALGDKDQAFAWLEKAQKEHDGILVRLKVDPRYDGLRSDPRFAELTKRAGLPD